MSSANTHLRDHNPIMQLPGRALLYGLAIWVIWTTQVIVAFETLPADVAASALFVSMKVVVLVTLVPAIHYVRKVTESSFREGLLIGVGWALPLVALELAHSLMAPFDIVKYFADVAPSYVVVPITTTLVMGSLERGTRQVPHRGGHRDLAAG